MTNESNELSLARDHLRNAERLALSVDTPYHLEEAAEQLEYVIELNTPEATAARNIGNTYGRKFRYTIRTKLSIANLPETQLEQMLDIAKSLESHPVYGCAEVGHTKVEIARRLFDVYYEGWDESEKHKQIRQIIGSLRTSREIIASFSEKSPDS